MNILKWILIVSSGVMSGCVTLPPDRLPLQLNEVQSLGKQDVATDALIDQIEQRGVDFEMTQASATQLKSAGVREPVIRYLQGRAAGERAASRNYSLREPFGDPLCSYNRLLHPMPARYFLVR